MMRYAVNVAFVPYEGLILSAYFQVLRGVTVLSKDREFYLRRLHSLLGIIPVGLFMTQHFVVNHFATRGEESFNTAAHFMESFRSVLFLRMVCHLHSIDVPCVLWSLHSIYCEK